MGVVVFVGILLSWPMERFRLSRIAFVGSLSYALAVFVSSFSVSITMMLLSNGLLGGMYTHITL